MSVTSFIKTARTLGPRTTAKRIWNALRVKSGWIERIDPATPFGPSQLTSKLSNGNDFESMLERRRRGEIPFFFKPDEVLTIGELAKRLTGEEGASVLAVAESLASGRMRYFSRWDADVGNPVQWHRNPLNGKIWPTDQHWSRLANLDPELGDIKLVWEMGRFPFLFTLTRAYAMTGDVGYLQFGLDLIEDWIDKNTPALGPHWNCGQETSLRLFAWMFFLQACYGTDVLDVGRWSKVVASLYRQALRVENYISFACSIRNNHSLSEAAGLYTVGAMFPEFEGAARLRDKGIRIFEDEAAYQIFDDGSYIQHSMNYHRLMLCNGLWMRRLATLNDDSLSNAIGQRLDRAAAFLYEMMDIQSGRVPNYGPNDGALILPLTSCDYLDYRPAIQASAALRGAKQPFGAGSWDELAIWMGLQNKRGRDAANNFPDVSQSQVGKTVPAWPAPSSRSFETGGYYTFRSGNTFAMTRCHSFIERPTDADMLHFDLWYDGINVLRDGGSYSYNCPQPYRDYFKSTAAHNTVEVGDQSQMVKGPRFMWYDWTKARFLGRGKLDDEEGEWWEGEHYGYQKRFGVYHRRRIERRGDRQWKIIDSLGPIGIAKATLRWRFGEFPYQFDASALTVKLELPNSDMKLKVGIEGESNRDATIYRGDESVERVEGWESLYYYEKQPTPVFRLAVSSKSKLTITTDIILTPRQTN